MKRRKRLSSRRRTSRLPDVDDDEQSRGEEKEEPVPGMNATRIDFEVSWRGRLSNEVAGDARVEALIRRLDLLDDVHVGVTGRRGSLEIRKKSS